MPADEARACRQRRPEKTVLYRLIQQHLESFLEHVHDASGKRLPKYVENEFRRYLECGLPNGGALDPARSLGGGVAALARRRGSRPRSVSSSRCPDA